MVGLLRGQLLLPAAQPRQQLPCAAPCPATSPAAPSQPWHREHLPGHAVELFLRLCRPPLLPWDSQCCRAMRGCGAEGVDVAGSEWGGLAAAWCEQALGYRSMDSGLKGLLAHGKHGCAQGLE